MYHYVVDLYSNEPLWFIAGLIIGALLMAVIDFIIDNWR